MKKRSLTQREREEFRRRFAENRGIRLTPFQVRDFNLRFGIPEVRVVYAKPVRTTPPEKS